MVKIETRYRIPIRRTFGRIPWHVIPEPPATLQGAATWRIQCHDPRAMCHIAGCCHLVNLLSRFHSHMPHCRVQSPGEINVMIVPHCRCNNSIRRIENRFSPNLFLFKCSLGFDERRLSYRLRYTCFICLFNIS